MRTGKRRIVRASWGWGLVVAVLMLGGFVAPAALIAEDDVYSSDAYAEEEGPVKDCLDKAQLSYNDCLMGASSWWGRKMCDLEWQSEVALCWAIQIGNIRRAYEGGGEEQN